MIEVLEIEDTDDERFLKLTVSDSKGLELGQELSDDLFGSKLYVCKIDGNNVHVSRKPLISSCVINNPTH